jgi:hypothetical protein
MLHTALFSSLSLFSLYMSPFYVAVYIVSFLQIPPFRGAAICIN